MKERPILFSAPMVRAILAGAKTQTRRLVRDQHSLAWGDVSPAVIARCPYGAPGDRLWVRETWAAQHDFDAFKPSEINCDAHWHYAATEERGGLLWRPSIHMPRWASRITLEVTDVRVQRLQEISEADARAEGVAPHVTSGKVYPSKCAANVEYHCYRDGFAQLWDSINGKRAEWSSNPWVWAVTFNRIEEVARG